MVLPGVSIAEDVAALNRGDGMWLGENRWEIHGRVYRDKGNGQVFPILGDRVIAVPRLELIALCRLIGMDGDIGSWYAVTDRDPNLNIEDDTIRKRAIELYDVWKTAQDDPP